MSETQISEIKPFRQVPSCDADAMLTITGAEYETIQNVLNAFRGPLGALDSVFQRNLNAGTIVIKYIQEDGTEIPKDEALKYIEQARDFLKDKDNLPTQPTQSPSIDSKA